jgi:acyl-coenzyme A thioesterase PaaI-like protein
MSTERGRPDANHCFVCGPDNPAGLQIDFRIDGDVCRASFSSNENHVGYDSQLHGGILYSVLDDVMANWLFLQGIRAHTAKCEIRYRKAVEICTELALEGRMIKCKGRLAVMEGKAYRAADNELIADAQASFMIVDD